MVSIQGDKMRHRVRNAAAIGILASATGLTTTGTASAAQAYPQTGGLAATAVGKITVGPPVAAAHADGMAVVTTSAVREEDPADDLCAPAVAAAIYGLGAAALTAAVAAAVASGAAEVTIIGYTLTTDQWGEIAAAIGSFSAVEDLVQEYIC
jgi:hypothetical protein